MNEEHNMLGRSFAYGCHVSVVDANGHCLVTLTDDDGKPFNVGAMPYDTWAEVNNFVRDAARRLLAEHGQEPWDGITVKDVAIDVLERYAEFYKLRSSLTEIAPEVFELELADFRKRLEDADLKDFHNTIEPMQDSADQRAHLVAAALAGVQTGFANPLGLAVERPENELLSAAFTEGLIIGRHLAALIPDSDRLLNSFARVATFATMSLWDAHHGIQLDEHDTVEFAQTMFALFKKFSDKARTAEAAAFTDQAVNASSMMAAVQTLIKQRKQTTDGNPVKDPGADPAGRPAGGPGVPPDVSGV